jgi:uncharacterized Zn finger protein
MDSIKSFLTESNLADLASRSNFRYGKQIAADGEIEILDSNTFNLVCKVKFKNHQTRTVELRSTTKGFRFKCTCSSKKDFFCQHCVAAGLSTIKE